MGITGTTKTKTRKKEEQPKKEEEEEEEQEEPVWTAYGPDRERVVEKTP
jgi:hypothetical protein